MIYIIMFIVSGIWLICDLFVMHKYHKQIKVLKGLKEWVEQYDKDPDEYITILTNIEKQIKLTSKEIKKNESK